MKNIHSNTPGVLTRFRESIKVKDIVSIIAGSFFIAFSIQLLLVPARILTGGVAGITMVLHFVSGLPTWGWFLALNIPLFIAGFRFLSKRFAFYSLLSMLFITALLAIFSNMSIKVALDDILLTTVLGGVINGLGVGLTLRHHGSSGGLDIIAAIIHRYWGLNLGTTIFTCNLLVLALALITSNLELTLYSAISMFVSSRVIDAVTAGLDARKTIMIVSQKSEEIAHAILETVHRGCTYIVGRGAYTGNSENIIIVTVSRMQVPAVKEIISEIDPQAFITITDTIEVYGRGFKSSYNEY